MIYLTATLVVIGMPFFFAPLDDLVPSGPLHVMAVL